jgi:hypothetical protein
MLYEPAKKMSTKEADSDWSMKSDVSNHTAYEQAVVSLDASGTSWPQIKGCPKDPKGFFKLVS